jgi:hypothetical protein
MAEHIVKRILSTATNIASKSHKRILTNDTGATSAKPSSTISLINDIPMTKTMADLPGPNGYPLVGTAPEYFRGKNKGQMHKVQVILFILSVLYLRDHILSFEIFDVCTARESKHSDIRSIFPNFIFS